MKHNQVKIKYEGQKIVLDIETGDFLIVCNGRWPLARAIKRVTYLKDKQLVALRAHHTGVFLVSDVSTIVREMDYDRENKRLGDQFTVWSGNKYQNGQAKDRKLVLMKPIKPYPDPHALQRDLETWRGPYSVRILFAHLWRRLTGRDVSPGGRGHVCSGFTAAKVNKHYKEYFENPRMVSPREFMEGIMADFDVYILN